MGRGKSLGGQAFPMSPQKEIPFFDVRNELLEGLEETTSTEVLVTQKNQRHYRISSLLFCFEQGKSTQF